MNDKRLYNDLIQAARSMPEDDRVPYSFAKRIMATLPRQVKTDPMAFWARGLWRASVPCLTLMVAMGTWSLVQGQSTSTIDPLAADLELTMLQPFDELTVEELW